MRPRSRCIATRTITTTIPRATSCRLPTTHTTIATRTIIRIVMDDFLIRALIAGVAVAIAAGPLGSFVVWRRLAYFGDTLSHSALVGIALGLAIGIDLTVAIAVVCAVVALALAGLQSQRTFA